MLFNSISFLIFFPLVTVLYFLSPQRVRTPLLLAASCIFYMAFVPLYVLILAFTIVVDYLAGIWIERSTGPARKTALVASIVANVGVLAFFKYWGFLTHNADAILGWLNSPMLLPALRIILPIGLSFHTFQAMSYTIEVYRGRQKAERDFLTYALYVMFYPQLVAGPIERPQNLLPQFREHHRFEYTRVVRGLLRMAIGMFKKVMIADALANYVNEIYGHPRQFHGLALLVATIFFAFQIYWDFSGYSDIALGSAEVMGFRLMENFRTPYAARGIREFWGRWHISLSTWFRDYLYIPLGGNRAHHYRNLMIVFLLSGLWHGANWTFVIWGGLHGMFLLLGDRLQGMRERVLAALRLPRESVLVHALSVMNTFALVTLAWVFFRAATLSDAFYVLAHIPDRLGTDLLALLSRHPVEGFSYRVALGFVLIAGMVVFEHLASSKAENETSFILRMPLTLRYAAYFTLIYASLLHSGIGRPQFIYFQF
jgi:alginate O-acetyltransferase complex protein AlgI